MKAQFTTPRCAAAGKAVLAALLVLLVLSSSLFAASALLHQSLHADSASEHHFCAIATFAGGSVEVAEVALPLPPLPVVERAVPVTAVDFVSSPDRTMLPVRGPPAWL